MNSASVPEGPGSVSGAPHLPDGFAGTFTSRYIDTGGLVQHVVTGGGGPPLLLVHGWPQTWYAWRLVMPGLARQFQVIAPDQRGCGLSGRPQDGYDTGTLAGDLAALMDALGHQRFAVAGHDTGMWIGYALAADHPGRVARLAVAETPLPEHHPVVLTAGSGQRVEVPSGSAPQWPGPLAEPASPRSVIFNTTSQEGPR
jgi:pimeloyl-ACP methyl ester carboxylesterase